MGMKNNILFSVIPHLIKPPGACCVIHCCSVCETVASVPNTKRREGRIEGLEREIGRGEGGKRGRGGGKKRRREEEKGEEKDRRRKQIN